MEKKKKIEEMYFIQKMSLTNIASALKISVSYVSRILRNNNNYRDEQEKRKKENSTKRKEQQKEMIYKQRKEKSRQNLMEIQVMKALHEQDRRELSSRKVFGNEALRRWCSLYKYDKEHNRYEFDTTQALKPRDFPLYIKV